MQRGDFLPPRRRDATIDPALEAVCLKAMAHRPEDRYASPTALADDLERWMADEPVTAWREPISRRARRWANRNRTAVTAAAVALVAGVVGLSAVLVVSADQRANAELTRSRAAVQARYDLAVEAIRTFHTGVSEDFLLKQDQFKDVRDRLLKSASDFYGKLGRLLGQESDPASRRALWRANYEVAELTARVGKPEDALVAHRQVLAAREALRAEAPADPDLTADLARSLTAVAQLLETTGQTQEAEVTYRKAEALLVEPAPMTAKAAARAVLADCRRRLGSLLRRTGRNDEALSVFRPGACGPGGAGPRPRGDGRVPAGTWRPRSWGSPICCRERAKQRRRRPSTARRWRSSRSWPTPTPPSPNSAAPWRLGHNNLGILLTETGRSAAAETEYRKAMAIQQELADANPGVIDFRKSLASTHHNLGWLLHQTGESSEAAAEYREALAILQKLADDNPSVTEFHSRLALSHNNLAFLLSHTGEPSEATAEYRKAQAILQKLADDNPALTDFRHRLGLTFNGFGWLLHRDGQDRGGGGRVPQGAGTVSEAGRRQPRRHRIPQLPGVQPQQPRRPAAGYGPVIGSGGRVRQGTVAAAEAGRRQPRRPSIPEGTGGQPAQPRFSARAGREDGRGDRLLRAGRGDPTEARRGRLGDPRGQGGSGELPDQHGGPAPSVGQAGRGARRLRACPGVA